MTHVCQTSDSVQLKGKLISLLDVVGYKIIGMKDDKPLSWKKNITVIAIFTSVHFLNIINSCMENERK